MLFRCLTRLAVPEFIKTSKIANDALVTRLFLRISENTRQARSASDGPERGRLARKPGGRDARAPG